jgi:MYXO-CTERM domain-containing protein
MSSICDTRSGHKYCTSECDPAAPLCPSGLECVPDSDTHLCQKPHGSGCSTAPGSPEGSAFGFFLMMAMIAALRLRRTRA